MNPTVKAVIRVSVGNFLEMYSFMVFGYYASAIGTAFFPSGNQYASLMLAFTTFGVGFLMRPLGAIVLGAYADRHGRRAGLLLTSSLTSIGILLIAFAPGYASIGLVAPLIVLSGRLLQGLSVGMQLGGVSVYLSEIATPRHKGFYVSWQSASQQAAVIFAALLGVFLNARLSPAEMNQWGWRVPLLVGCATIPCLFALRLSLEETGAFLARRSHLATSAVFRSLASNARFIVVSTMLVTMTTVSFNTIATFTPTFGSAVLKLSNLASLMVTLCVGVSNLIWLPVMGALSDRVGRRPLLIAATVLMLGSAYPAMRSLVDAPSFSKLLAVELWLSFLFASYNGAMVVYLTELIPIHFRTAGFSLAYSLAAGVFGGFTPAVNTYLIHLTGNRAMPGAWLSFAAGCGLTAAILARPWADGTMSRACESTSAPAA
jgi:MFS family permease